MQAQYARGEAKGSMEADKKTVPVFFDRTYGFKILAVPWVSGKGHQEEPAVLCLIILTAFSPR